MPEDHQAIADSIQAEAKRISEMLGLDSVQIVATYQSSDGTTTRASGGYGNWYARLGSMSEWMHFNFNTTKPKEQD